MMKSSFFLLALAGNLWGMSYGTGIKGNGVDSSRELELSSFQHLVVSHSLDVVVHCGEPVRGQLQGDANLLDLVTIDQSGDVLRLGIEGEIHGDHSLLVELWTGNLHSVEASGATTVDVFALKADEFKVGASGASDVRLEGEVGRMTIDLSGASDLKARPCPARHISADLSGASDAKVTVVESLDADCSGASDLYYWGHPEKVRVDTSGAASAKSRSEQGVNSNVM